MGIIIYTLRREKPLFSDRLNTRHIKAISRMMILGLLVVAMLLTACTGGGDDDAAKGNPSASATPAVTQIRVSVAQAPIFTAPSSDSEIIINLFEGDIRRTLGKSEPDQVGLIYYQIDLGNRLGWVAETQVEIQGDADSLVLVDTTATIPPAATLVNSTSIADSDGTPMVKVDRARTIVFASPQRTAEEIATIFEDEEFVALARTEADNLGDIYYLIQIGETQGWVLASQVAFSGDDAQLVVANVVTTTPTTTAEADSSTTAPTTIPTNTQAVATLVPSGTPTFTPLPIETQAPGATVAPDASPQATATFSDELEIQAGPEPPLTIELPEGWEGENFLVPVANLFAAGNIAMSVYEGPLADGKTGHIWILWGFPNIADPFGGVNLWSDGLQLLRGLLFFECNIGIDTKREFTIDNQTAEGTYYSAVDCAQGADIAGWFGALQYEGGNFAVFTGIEPVERVTEGLPEIQAIVDSIKFEALD